MKPIPYRQRVGLLALLCGCSLFLLVCRLTALQVFDHEEWLELADRLRSGWRPVRPMRGEIVDGKGRVLAHDAAGFELAVLAMPWRDGRFECEKCGTEHLHVPRRCRRCRESGKKFVKRADERDMRPIAKLLDIRVRELEALVKKRVVAVERHVEELLGNLTGVKRERQRRELWFDHGRRPQRIRRDVSYEVAREVALQRRRNPAFVIRTSHGRVYPGGAVFTHILGRLVEAESIVVERGDGTARKLPVEVGRSGVEYHFESELRGAPGWVEMKRDLRKRTRTVLDERRAEPGRRIRLTIETEVQERAAAALGDVEGAFVVVHAETGAVLALVTAPRYEPHDYVGTLQKWIARGEEMGTQAPVGSPIPERAFRNYQIPGSIMKPFTALAALDSGDGSFSEVIQCEREFRYHGIRAIGKLRCNMLHNELNMHGALRISCNIYFQTLVARMLDKGRFPAFVRMGRRFGFGQRTGIEIASRNPDTKFGRWDFDAARQPGTLIASAIGQGWVVTSPAQIARAYAGLATGSLPRLHLIARLGDTATAPERVALRISRDRLERVRAALRDVPRPGGSAYDYAGELARYQMACKTGTAQRGTRKNNAWMAGFAPARAGRPPIAFAMAVLRSDLGGGATCGPRLVEFFRYYYSGGKQ